MQRSTGLQLARRRAPRCPCCTHGARLERLEHLHARACRWGHVVAEAELLEVEPCRSRRR